MLNLKIEGVREALAALGKLSRELEGRLQQALRKCGALVAGEARRQVYKGHGAGHLNQGTHPGGQLRAHIMYEVHGSEAWVGTYAIPYARIHELGGTIVPKGHPFLSIPVGDREGSPRQYADLHFQPTGRGGVLIDEAGKLQYALVRSVTIPARPYLGPALDASHNEIEAAFSRVIQGALP